MTMATPTSSPPLSRPAQDTPAGREAQDSSSTSQEPDAPPAPLLDGRTDFNVIFIHSRLDDYGLSPQQFRVYAHLARRAGSGGAWSSVARMAHVCKLHPQTVRAALRVLVRHRLITRQPRPSTTPIYRLTKADQWEPPTSITGHPSERITPPSVSEGGTTKRIQDHPYEKDAGEGNPTEGNPPKAKGGKNTGLASEWNPGRTSGVKERQLRTQFVALRAQVKDLESHSEDLTPAEREQLRKKRMELKAIQQQQASGHF